MRLINVNKKYYAFIFPIIFTSLILTFLFYSISIKEIINAFQTIPFNLILLGFIFHLSAYFFRTLTFWIFLKEERISFFNLLNAHFIHNFYMQIIPANLGELSFPVILKKKISMAKTLSVLFLSRISLLILSIIIFLFCTLYIFNIKFIFQIQKIPHILITLGTLLILIILVIKFKPIILKMKYFTKVVKIIESLRAYSVKIKEPRRLIELIGYSLFTLLALTLYYWMILKGVNIHLNLLEVFYVSTIGIAFLLLPIKSVAGFGTIEGGWVIGLMLLNISKTQAIKAGFAIHLYALANVFILFIFGMLYFLLKRRMKEKS